jgi:hypothetical protein
LFVCLFVGACNSIKLNFCQSPALNPAIIDIF